MKLAEPRVLVCGDRRWLWPGTVAAVLDRLAARYGDRLVVIEGAANGADRAAHRWCRRRGLGMDRHRCHPVDWESERRARPRTWRLAGPERNTRMLAEQPSLVIASTASSILGPAGHPTCACGACSAACPRGWCRARIRMPGGGCS
ncbi:SLOG family protein [Streptomyces sp. NPDC002845]